MSPINPAAGKKQQLLGKLGVFKLQFSIPQSIGLPLSFPLHPQRAAIILTRTHARLHPLSPPSPSSPLAQPHLPAQCVQCTG